jgi:dUTP pyrophosphatase
VQEWPTLNNENNKENGNLPKIIKESENFVPDKEYQKELEDFINQNFGEEFETNLNNSIRTQTLKVKKLNPDAVLPKYNYPSDSGFDLHSVEDIIIPAFGRAFVPTGLSFQFSEGLEIQVRTKSGLAINQGLMVLNSPGTVDQGYSGEIKVIIFNTNNATVTIPKGMKVAQAVLCPVLNGKFVDLVEVDTFEETDRGSNGFGSTGII